MSGDLERIAVDLLASSPFGVLVWYLDDPADDMSLRLRYASPAAGRLLAIDLKSCLGKTMLEVFPSVTTERVRQYAQVCRERTARDMGQTFYGDSRVQTGAFSVSAVPVLDRGVGAGFGDPGPLRPARARAQKDHT